MAGSKISTHHNCVMPDSIPPPRSLRLIKSLCWILLLTGAGVLILFVAISASRGIHVSSQDRILLGVASVLMLGSAWALRICYRREPSNFTGFWQLSLADLIVCTFFSGSIMGLYRGFWPGEFVPTGIILALLTGFVFSICLMLAVRRGCVRWPRKLACAFGYLLWVMGWMITGTFCFVLVFITILNSQKNDVAQLLGALLFLLPPRNAPDAWMLNLFRIGFLAIPAGFYLRRWALSAAAKKREPQ